MSTDCLYIGQNLIAVCHFYAERLMAKVQKPEN